MRSSRAEQARSKDVLVLDTRHLEPFEIGAKLDALLCYPTWSADRQQKIADAICTLLVSHTIASDPSRTKDLRSQYPQYAKGRNRTKLGSQDYRREKAIRIGAAFLPYLKEPAIGELPQFRGQARKLTLAEIVRYLWPKRRGAKFDYEEWLKDREKDVRLFRPIAHLAAAYQWIARERSGDEASATFDYQDLQLHREVVRRANEFARYFRLAPALKDVADRLIEIEWRE